MMKPTSYCAKCGHELSPDDKFCFYCGSQIQNGPLSIQAKLSTDRMDSVNNTSVTSPTPKEAIANDKCWKCDRIIPADALFCPYCQTEQKKECPACHKTVEPIFTFCPSCGHSLAHSEKEDVLKEEVPSIGRVIGEGEYSNKTGTVIIPDDVTEIRDNSFSDSDIDTLVIPDSVVRICECAFEQCRIKKIVVSPGNHTYDSRDNCNAIIKTENNTLIVGCEGTVIPNTVSRIAEHSFGAYYELESLVIPASVIQIDGNPFSCTHPRTIRVSPGNPKYDSRGNCNAIIETRTNTLLFGVDNTVIPNSITRIGKFAFRFNKPTSLRLPKSVEVIEDYAFEGELKSIEIPESVIEIGESAFYTLEAESIVVSSKNPRYDSRNNCNAIIETNSNTLVFSCDNTIIPDTVTRIGDSAFACSFIKSIELPDSITEIGDYAFQCALILEQVSLPDSLKSIGVSAFESTSIESIKIPDSVGYIGDGAFDDCDNLKTIIIRNRDLLAGIDLPDGVKIVSP